MPNDDIKDGQISYHSGYKVFELFIKPRYESFGAEIMNYTNLDGYMSSKQLRDSVMMKARQYINTKKVKEYEYIADKYSPRPRHYGITNKFLQINNLMSIILYTDTTILSSNFSSSFRAITPFETVSQIKHRNSKYYFWSKY